LRLVQTGDDILIAGTIFVTSESSLSRPDDQGTVLRCPTVASKFFNVKYPFRHWDLLIPLSTDYCGGGLFPQG